MNEIINILMRRDGISENEARNLVEECRKEIEAVIAGGRYMEAEDIIASYLELEPDYIMDLIDVFQRYI